MKQTIVTFLICLCFVQAEAQFPQIKWWFDTHDASFGQTAAGDIDGDGRFEVVFGCYRNDSCVYALNAEDGSLLWKYNTHPAGAEGCNDVAPVLYDMDGDDSLEVIVPSSCNPKTFCFRGSNGAVQWQTPTAGSDSPPTVADLDGNVNPEILHGGFDGHVLCINGENGSVAWSLTVNNNSWVQTAPTIEDLDGDGDLDFVVATWAFGNDTSRVYAYRGTDHSLMWSEPLPDVVYHGTAVADLDGDSKPELVIGSYDGKLYVFNGEDGSKAWDYQGDYYIGAPASIADLDSDGLSEVVFCDAWGVGSLTSGGDLNWYYPIPGNGNAFRGVAIADIDGDDMPDLAFGTSNGKVIALHGDDGSVIFNLDLAAHYGNPFEIDHAPVIADFDNDNTIDIFLVGGHTEYPNFQDNYGRGYMISAGAGRGPAWTMFQHDVRRRSNLSDSTMTPVPEQEPGIPEDLMIRPNPAGDRITVTASRPGLLEILDCTGRIRMTFACGNETVSIDVRNLEPGIYIARMNTDHSRSACKIIIR